MSTSATGVRRGGLLGVPLHADSLNEHVAKIVAAWPPLTREQLDGITVVLAGARKAATTEAAVGRTGKLEHMSAVRATRHLGVAA